MSSNYDRALARQIETTGHQGLKFCDWQADDQLSKSFALSVFGPGVVSKMEGLDQATNQAQEAPAVDQADPAPQLLEKSIPEPKPKHRPAPRKNTGPALVIFADRPAPKKEPVRSDRDEKMLRSMAFIEKMATIEEQNEKLKAALAAK